MAREFVISPEQFIEKSS